MSCKQCGKKSDRKICKKCLEEFLDRHDMIAAGTAL